MQQIDFASVVRWGNQGAAGARAPIVIRGLCPYCNERVIFSLSHHTEDPGRMTVAANAVCPACQRGVRFWSVRDSSKPKDEEGNPAAIFMYPPAITQYPYPTLSDGIPERLRSSLFATIDAFNAKIYGATAVSGRVTLEGIFKYRVPEGKRKESLMKLIEIVKADSSLAEPLTALSHVIRTGGNLGAHFHEEREPTEAVARGIVELLDYLISYLYVLPEKIKSLEKDLGAKPATSSPPATDTPTS